MVFIFLAYFTLYNGLQFHPSHGLLHVLSQEGSHSLKGMYILLLLCVVFLQMSGQLILSLLIFYLSVLLVIETQIKVSNYYY